MKILIIFLDTDSIYTRYYLEKEPESAKMLLSDGGYAEVPFRALGDGIYEFSAKAEPMYPTVIIIK